MSQPETVDLDLDVLAPPPRSFRIGGERYELPGEVPIPTIVTALRLHEKLKQAEIGSDEMLSALEELYELEIELVRIRQPDVEKLMIGETQLMQLFGLIVAGPDAGDLTEAVAAALQTGGAELDEEGHVQTLPPTPPKRARKRSGSAPGRSRKRSPAASSV